MSKLATNDLPFPVVTMGYSRSDHNHIEQPFISGPVKLSSWICGSIRSVSGVFLLFVFLEKEGISAAILVLMRSRGGVQSVPTGGELRSFIWVGRTTIAAVSRSADHPPRRYTSKLNRTKSPLASVWMTSSVIAPQEAGKLMFCGRVVKL